MIWRLFKGKTLTRVGLIVLTAIVVVLMFSSRHCKIQKRNDDTAVKLFQKLDLKKDTTPTIFHESEILYKSGDGGAVGKRYQKTDSPAFVTPDIAMEKDANLKISHASDILYNSGDVRLSYVVTEVAERPKVSKRSVSRIRSKELLSLIKNMTSSGISVNDDDVFLCMMFNLGRLGNQMYQYASLYGMAKHAGMLPLCDNRLKEKLGKTFKLESEMCYSVDYKLPICSQLHHRADRYHSSFDWLHMDALTERPLGNVALTGFYETWFYFYDYWDDILRDYTLIDSLQQKADIIIRNSSIQFRSFLNVGNDVTLTYVGVHVRHGDVTSMRKLENGYMSPTMQYYAHGIQYFQERYKNVVFIVTTDDRKWVVSEFNRVVKEKLKVPYVVIEGTSANIDFAILKSCNHTIMSVGTYGVWASLLGKGDTVYYEVPVQPGSHAGKAYSRHMDDFYLPYWTRIV